MRSPWDRYVKTVYAPSGFKQFKSDAGEANRWQPELGSDLWHRSRHNIIAGKASNWSIRGNERVA